MRGRRTCAAQAVRHAAARSSWVSCQAWMAPRQKDCGQDSEGEGEEQGGEEEDGTEEGKRVLGTLGLELQRVVLVVVWSRWHVETVFLLCAGASLCLRWRRGEEEGPADWLLAGLELGVLGFLSRVWRNSQLLEQVCARGAACLVEDG